MIVIDDKNFESEVLSSAKPVIVDCMANWCSPCKMAGPIFAELEKEMSDKVKFAKMDVDQNINLANMYNVSSIPAFLIFKGGDLVKTTIGFQAKDKMKEIIESVI